MFLAPARRQKKSINDSQIDGRKEKITKLQFKYELALLICEELFPIVFKIQSNAKLSLTAESFPAKY